MADYAVQVRDDFSLILSVKINFVKFAHPPKRSQGDEISNLGSFVPPGLSSGLFAVDSGNPTSEQKCGSQFCSLEAGSSSGHAEKHFKSKKAFSVNWAHVVPSAPVPCLSRLTMRDHMHCCPKKTAA
jgi:hypothetical protein